MSACKLRGQSRISRPAQVSLLLAAWPAGSFGPAVARASRSGDGRAEVPAGAEVPADRRGGGRRQDHGHLRPRVEVQQAGAALADALRIKEGDVVVSRHQQRFIDGTAFSLQTSFYPMSLVEHGATRLIEAADLSEGTVAYLANTLGIKQVGYRDSIQVRPPDETESSFFRLPADGRVPVFEIYRVSFDETGQRIRLTITVYPVDRNCLRIDVGAIPRRQSDAAIRDKAQAPTVDGTPERDG
jgi:hypothetical protein